MAEAREHAVEAQKAIRKGLDPVEEHKREEQVTIHTVQGFFTDWHQIKSGRKTSLSQARHPTPNKRLIARRLVVLPLSWATPRLLRLRVMP
ncbi:hypothetical protein GCM10008094_19970 [Aidingimonas halophila]|nr:hypothetical protein GCM10008094_19970 [Aidingimonas halophila]